MRRGCRHGRTLANGESRRPQLVIIDRWRRYVEFQVTRGSESRRAEFGIALRIGRRLRQAQVETAQQRGDGARQIPPAVERPLRHATIEQDQWDTALGARHDHVRPQIGFHE